MTTSPAASQRPLLDAATTKSLQWAQVLQAFQPQTVAGCRVKQSLQPFQVGDEAVCQQVLAQLQQDSHALTATTQTDIAERLRRVPDIGDSLVGLASPGLTLSTKALLSLKLFALAGQSLWAVCALVAYEVPSIHWSDLLERFGTSASSFSVDDISDDDYRASATRYAAAIRTSATAAHDISQQWYTSYGIRPNRDGQLIFKLPDTLVQADQAKHDSRLAWVKDTPYERVFAVVQTTELRDIQKNLEDAKIRVNHAAQVCLSRLCDALRAVLPLWRRAAAAVVDLDIRVAKVTMLRQWNGTVPEVIGGNTGTAGAASTAGLDLGVTITLEEARHPLVERVLQAQQREFVPLSAMFSQGTNVISGLNMGGKTIGMSLVCLCQALLQYGFPVPARTFQSVLVDAIRFHEGASTDVESGLSSFGREMMSLRDTLIEAESGKRMLVCLDEPARSTNPEEGEALVVGCIRNVQHRTAEQIWIVATHFHGPLRQEGVRNFRIRGLRANFQTADVATRESRLRILAEAMDYRLEYVSDARLVPQEALAVAAWLGLPETVIDESKKYLRGGHFR